MGDWVWVTGCGLLGVDLGVDLGVGLDMGVDLGVDLGVGVGWSPTGDSHRFPSRFLVVPYP